jgi:hypothetical protein
MQSGLNVSSVSTIYNASIFGVVSKQAIEALTFFKTVFAALHITRRSQKGKLQA